ncbi:hypothetical protein A3J20_02770 [Candidatus Gottesmanbacteria bacterium RIFCSPLOWO2_02_FULL_42_29]|nr:MAG: hypothetical protein A3E72_00945 [Candidatus Gottesmanbacteria bacterium RIFCSPHIGHO2_12_FULL_43_26]OGG36839.1 MAG: hypothetical protein A3J20_02770 [Candidatus Gottesmanbacteria bacterium RIFCSPLOWO2_02_FULL_42_29]
MPKLPQTGSSVNYYSRFKIYWTELYAAVILWIVELQQKILGTEMRQVKYHGNVKFLIFECNNCLKPFSRMESYSRKQVKIHKNACCFCSPECRTSYFKKTKFQAPSAEKRSAAAKPKTKGKSSFFGWLGKLLND